MNNKILILLFLTAILVLASFGFAKEALAETTGYFISTNLLQGVFPEPTSIDSFVYTLSAKPPETEATVQFSQDNSSWYNSSGELDGINILNIGEDNEIYLSGLGWSGRNFYYKVTFISYNDTDTPVLEQIAVHYTKEESGCGTIIPDTGVSDCDGHPSAWTYCKCETETEGYRISPALNISGSGIVKDSRIFWQADEEFNGIISKVEVKISYNGGITWNDNWMPVANGGSIPGLEPGTDLSETKIKTKISFVGGPHYYPELKNIKIFVETE